VNDVNVNEIIESIVLCYPTAIVAAHEPNITKNGETLRCLGEHIAPIYRVFVPGESVHSGYLVKETREGGGGVTELDSEL